MGVPLEEFTQKQLDYLSDYMRRHANEWISEPALERYERQKEREMEQRERIVALEKGQNSILEQMKQGFERMDQRFEWMQTYMDKRFEQVDKQFEVMRADMEKRFEQVDKRFEQVDKRFEQVDKRFDDVNRNFGRVFAFLTTFFIVVGTLLALPYFQG